jgi:hypothetical protein
LKKSNGSSHVDAQNLSDKDFGKERRKFCSSELCIGSSLHFLLFLAIVFLFDAVDDTLS